MSIPDVTLSTGTKVPILAFGSGTALYNSDSSAPVSQAIKAGFRHLDMAEVYANSKATGNAIASCGVPRDQLYLLTKLGAKATKDTAGITREELELLHAAPALDAVLLHFPPRGKDGQPTNLAWWRELEKLKDQGIVKDIGVSNWMSEDIEELVAAGVKHLPTINQIEFHPHLFHHPDYQRLLATHKKHGIKAMVYGSLVSLYKPESADKAGKLPGVVQAVAKETDLSEAAVLLKWSVVRTDGGIVVTTSSKPERCRELIASFSQGAPELNTEQVERIDAATKGEAFRKVYMDVYWKP